jgi:hypothetical protein
VISYINFQTGNNYPSLPLVRILYHKPDEYLSLAHILMGYLIICGLAYGTNLASDIIVSRSSLRVLA